MPGQVDARPATPAHTAEFWTAQQRQANSLHEVSYRGCFKPQLPAYFINRFSRPGELVYDPFSGRGTTALEAGLLGRAVAANDVNPLSRMLLEPRFFLPEQDLLFHRLTALSATTSGANGDELDLSMFFHPDTEREIRQLRTALRARLEDGREDALDRWIRMVATNRLTGHSPGFFSVYSLPPNQAVSQDSQKKINARLDQSPPYRDTRALIVRKTRSLLRNVTADQREALARAGATAVFLTGDARRTPGLAGQSVALTVTSPPFLDVVDYATDNWLRCWFNGIDADVIAAGLTTPRGLAAWSETMGGVLNELQRITRPGGHIAFEVGEVRGGKIRLDETVVPLGEAAGLTTIGIWINTQRFTKTSNIWGVSNNTRGTNTNRVVVFQKS
ncbi:MAG: DNA methyltransferase [Thermoflexales bacterium]